MVVIVRQTWKNVYISFKAVEIILSDMTTLISFSVSWRALQQGGCLRQLVLDDGLYCILTTIPSSPVSENSLEAVFATRHLAWPPHHSFASSPAEPRPGRANPGLGLPGAAHHRLWSPAGQPHHRTQVKGFNGSIQAWENSLRAGEQAWEFGLYLLQNEWKDGWKKRDTLKLTS